jgi:transcriptional repressor NrdR
VYKAFDSVDDFATEIAELMARAADGELAEHTAHRDEPREHDSTTQHP